MRAGIGVAPDQPSPAERSAAVKRGTTTGTNARPERKGDRTLLLIEQQGLTNLRVLHGDALDLIMRRLQPGSLREILVFFPDPWPKARHHKRRLVRPEFAAAVVRVLEPEGRLHLATDDREYAQVMREVLEGRPELTCTHDGARVPARPRTRYELAGERAGRHAVDLVYRFAAPSEV